MKQRLYSRQSGLVLWLALVLLMALSTAMMFMVASGRLFSEKTRLVSAADQAALGAAIWRARVLNFDAYANRAILAQEVAVAQALTLVSWARYFERLTGEAAALRQIPAEWQWLMQPATVTGSQQSRLLAEQAASLEIWLRSAPESGYKALLAANQALLHQSATVFGLGAVANEVARATDPRYFAFVMSDQGGFASLVADQDSDQNRARFANWVLDSLDPFVKGPRSADMPVVMSDPCMPGSIGEPLQFRKRGVTVLTSQMEQWLALDNASLHHRGSSDSLLVEGGSGSVLCAGSERHVLGWGAAGAYSRSGMPRSQLTDVESNPVAYRRALDELAGRSMDALNLYDGIANVRDIARELRESAQPARSSLAVLARIEGRRLRLTQAANADRHQLGMSTSLPGQRLWALSAAEVYFRKPGMPDETVESASLFSPYWQARLVTPGVTLRQQAQGYVQ